jgi:hypothetical protein
LTSEAGTSGRGAKGGASNRKPLSFALLSAATFWASPAAAQDYEAVFHTMEDCAAIGDVPERVACYDRTIAGARAAIGEGRGAAVAAPSTTRAGFGRESMPSQDAPKAPKPAGTAQSEDEMESVSRVVSRSRPLQGGIYVVEFDDGTEWQFVEGVPLHFNPPREGEQVEIRRGALGSFRMLIEGEDPVRVKRAR